MWILYSDVVFHCTKLLLHIVNWSATIVCLGCFIKALKVSSSLYRDTKIKKRIFFLTKTHKHSHTNTHSSCIHFISARLCNCKNTQSSRLFQRRCFYYFYRSTIQYADNKRFDCLNKNSTHLKLSRFIERVLHCWALFACISDTLVNWCSGALTSLFQVCKYTLSQSLLWQCRSTLVCAFIGFGQQMACHGWFCVQLGDLRVWLYVYLLLKFQQNQFGLVGCGHKDEVSWE